MIFFATLRPRFCPCQHWRHVAGVLVVAALISFTALPAAVAAAPAVQEPAGHAQPSAEGPATETPAVHDTQAGHGQAGEGHEAGSIWGFVGKIVNFVLLVGTLVYFLRAPIANYLASRHTQVRADLEAAAAMKRSAEAQIAEMEKKLQALPHELDELKARGQAEIAAEEARIRELAEAERVRLVEQASREIEQQVRVAQRTLVEHAADLAVGVAQTKIKRDITTDDQARLVTSYLDQVKHHE